MGKVQRSNIIGAVWHFILHNIVWRISGTHRKLQDIKDGKEKVYTAQVLHNWYTLPGNYFIGLHNFIFSHDHFAPAKTILRDNVHLLGFENDVVKFIELDPKADVFNLRKHPILFMAQICLVRKIIVVPLKDFTEILDDNYVEGTKVAWCFHTVRCGSTVWSQMFAALPNWVTYSEAQPLFYSIVRAKSFLDVAAFAKTEEYEKLVVASIKMHILMAPKGHSIFWKTTGIDEHMVPIIKKHFPSHSILFACRDVLPCATSYYKAFGQLNDHLDYLSDFQGEFLNANLSGERRVVWLWFTNGYNSQFCSQLVNDHKPGPNAFEWFVVLWAAKVSMMMQYRKDGIHFKVLKYEELRRDPIGTITELFRHLNISLDLVEVAHKTMELDSQAGTFFSHDRTVEHGAWLRTPDCDRRCNGILKDFGLPDMDSHLDI